MKKYQLLLLAVFCLPWVANAQRKHTEKFEQLGFELRDPSTYRTASGAPGHDYWQQQVDYVIDVTLDETKQTIKGTETITYINNSPDELTYLWVQLDQNMRAKESDTYKARTSRMSEEIQPWSAAGLMKPWFDGGHKVTRVQDTDGDDLNYVINKTMMVVDLPKPLGPGQQFSFEIDWSYNIQDRFKMGGRSGYEFFPEQEEYIFTIAQFFPRLAVYSDTDGWQNKQFLGNGEFTLPFGNYEVSITVPKDHVVGATGELQNPVDVLTYDQLKLLEESKHSYDEPVIIVTEKEARKREKKPNRSEMVTWRFKAQNVRDFAFATSRKFIWDAMAVDINGKTTMAMSLYPKEGNPLWEDYSTKVVGLTLRVYSEYTIDYPYPVAYSVHTDRIGMEYPMICFNYGRPNSDGTYSDRLKYGMIGVIIHEVGHNFFPMIINSDERQWTWMDEGLNSFVQYLTQVQFNEEFKKADGTPEDFPHRGGPPKNITTYMKTDPSRLSPIMTNSENIQNFGPNAYTKPATGLNILRETVMGPELFDRAFKEYSRRWAFKHPSPTDFFRTMEDASAVDLDWFWRGWFFSVEHTDIALSEVTRWRMEGDEGSPEGEFETFVANLTEEQIEKLGKDMNYYELKLENKGGLVMPVILGIEYADGSQEIIRLPAEIWRYNDEQISKVLPSKKEIVSIVVDPLEETADVDMKNNYWGQDAEGTRFDKFREGRGDR